MHKGRYGKGYLRDTHNKSKDPPFRALSGARRGIPAASSLESYVTLTGIWDQKMTSSCTGQAFARAAHVRCAAEGVVIARPSALGPYTVGRKLGAPGQSLATIGDSGAEPIWVVSGLLDPAYSWGLAADADWPEGGWDAVYAADPGAATGELVFVDEEPDLAELEAAAVCQLTGYYRIDSTGSSRVADVQQAISLGYPVCIGVDVDQNFEDYAGGVNSDGSPKTITAPDPNNLLGGHMLCLLGYNGSLLRGVNSWGTGWGDGGMFWADPTFLTSDETSDIYVVTVTGLHAGTRPRTPKAKKEAPSAKAA